MSGVFIRPKKDNTYRMILNLKKLNAFIEYNHFKMESINHVIDIIKTGVYMASVDLKDAFYTIPIHRDHTKYLKFYHGSFYEFLCMPNGYSEAMRVFTKVLKPPFAYLRTQGHLSVVYVDDTYLQGDTYSQCQEC